MAKISLANVLSGFNLTKINDNFTKIQNALNNEVLYRDNPTNEDNTIRQDIDVNGRKLYNLAAPSGDSHAARLKDVKNAIAGLAGQTANLISFSPTSSIPSNNVQGAIEAISQYPVYGSTPKPLASKALQYVSVVDHGAIGDGVVDDTAAIQRALNSFPKQGSPNWQPWCLVIPTGTYKVSSTINIKNQQFGRIIGNAAQIIGNFDGPILQIGDMSNDNDVLWFHIEGLEVVQYSTGVNSRAVVMQHAYSCSVSKSYFYGGQYAFELDGNSNQIYDTTFRHGILANVSCAATANNEANTFHNCQSELSSGYGYSLSVNAGEGGFTRIIGGYMERNALGNVYIKNSQKFMVDGVYFNLQNGAAGIVFDGTVGPSYPSGYGNVQNCRIVGPSSGTTPPFIKHTNSMSVNCCYSQNTVETNTLCDLYGQAYLSVNLHRRRKMVFLRNAIDFVDADNNGIPDSWSRQGTGNIFATSCISPYGVGNSVAITPTNQFIYQDVTFPQNSLLRISAYVKTTGSDARIELWTSGLSGAYATAQCSSSTPQRVEMYISSAVLAGATGAKLLLRTRDSGTATFCDIEIEDMTN